MTIKNLAVEAKKIQLQLCQTIVSLVDILYILDN